MRRKRLYFAVLVSLLTLVSFTYGQDDEDNEARKIFIADRGRRLFLGGIAAPREKPLNTLGLGYTLLLRDNGKAFVHASANRVFKTGEAIRLLVESSREGYLYVFHREGSSPATMIFPNWKVDQGKNRILAHVPLEVPAGAELVFGEGPGTESLTLLVLLRPIEDLPTGEALKGKDNVIVSNDLFQRLSKPTQLRRDERVPEGARANVDAAKISSGLKLRTYDEAPDYIVLNHDPIETRLVATVQMTHR